MVLPFQTVSREPIAQAMTLDGRKVIVSRVTFNTDVPGMGREGFAVDVGGNADYPDQSYGFASEDDALGFLTSSESEEYTAINPMGQQVKESRTGLGVPDGMIRKSKGLLERSVVPVVAAPLPPPAAQFPQSAAAMNAPPDAADLPHGNLAGENASPRTENARNESVAVDEDTDASTGTETRPTPFVTATGRRIGDGPSGGGGGDFK